MFNTGIIEDHGNVNLNYYINVDSSTFTGTEFTLRITPEAHDDDDYTPKGLETLPWSSDVDVFFKDTLDDVKAGSSPEVAVIVKNYGPDDIVTGQFQLRVVNDDGTVGFRKTVSFSKLKTGKKQTFKVKCTFHTTAPQEVMLEVEVKAFGADGIFMGDSMSVMVV